MPSIWANFDHVFEVFQGLFFAGDEDEKKLLQNDDVISQVQVVCTNVLAIIIIFFLKINESKSGNIFFIHMLHTVHYVVVYYSQCNLDMLPQ